MLIFGTLFVVLALVVFVHCWRASLIVLGLLLALVAYGSSLTPHGAGAGSIAYQSGYR